MRQITPVPEPRCSDAQPRSFPVQLEKAHASTDALKIIMLPGDPSREGRAALYMELSRKQRQATRARSSVRPGEQTNIVRTKKGRSKARFDSGPVTAENN